MKRILVITVLAVLLLSTVGATVAVAKDRQPAGKSSIYQYDKDIDPAGHGKLIVNTKQLTYAFEARGCDPGTTYYLYYTDAGKRVDIASAAADTYGNLVIAGAYGTDVTIDQLVAATVTDKSPLKAVLTATFDGWEQPPPLYPTWAYMWKFDALSSQVPNNGNTWTYEVTIKTSQGMTINWPQDGPTTDPALGIRCGYILPGTFSATLTIREMLPNGEVGQIATDTLTDTQLLPPYPHP